MTKMLTPDTWILWGLGWLIMPRMIIGLLLMDLTPYHDLGLMLAIIGGVIDLGGAIYSNRGD